MPSPSNARRRLTIWLSIIIAVVVVIVVVAVVIAVSNHYADAENAKASPTPTVATDRATSTLQPAQLNGTWTVGSGSTAGYRLHEVLNGNSVTVTGRTKAVTGSATVENRAITAATITVQVAKIATDSSQRDAYFRDSAMDTDSFPTATFRLTKAIAGAVPTGTQTKTVTAEGALTLHGQTKTVEATLDIGLDGDDVDISGSIPITFSDYGVQAPSLGFVKVDKSGSVEFSVRAASTN